MALDHQTSRGIFDEDCRWPPMASPEPGVFIDDRVDPLSVAVAAAIQASDPGAYQDDGPPTCLICDGAGHGYVLGWEQVPGKGDVPILSSPCPLEDRCGLWPRRRGGDLVTQDPPSMPGRFASSRTARP